MSGLIAELQRDALDPTFPIDFLLRKMKLCSVKLALPALEAWVDSELNGYVGKDIPDYRQLRGEPRAWNPIHGWIPMMLHPNVMEIVTRAYISQSISSIRDLLDSPDDGSGIHFPIPYEIVNKLNQVSDFKTAKMVTVLSRSHLITIVETVRNMALDWSLEMEKQGVLGEGMSFGATERERAKTAMASFHIEHIGSFVGNMGNSNTSGDIVVSNVDARSIIEKVDSIRRAIPELETAGIDGKKLKNSLDAIEAEAKASKPDRGKLRTLLGSAREVLVGAAGNLTAEGALSLIKAATEAL